MPRVFMKVLVPRIPLLHPLNSPIEVVRSKDFDRLQARASMSRISRSSASISPTIYDVASKAGVSISTVSLR